MYNKEWNETQKAHHFADEKCILVNENSCILIWISFEFVPKGSIDNKSTMVQVMFDKPLPEPMLS